MLDKLHEGGIEIVSPNVMSTRSIPPDKIIAPDKTKKKAELHKESSIQAVPETTAFDKADEAESAQKLQERIEAIDKQIAELNDKLKSAAKEDGESLRQSVEELEKIKERITKILQKKADKLNESG